MGKQRHGIRALTAIAACAVALSLAGPARAANDSGTGSELALYPIDTSLVSAGAQAAAETEVAAFTQVHPVPTFSMGSDENAFEQFNAELQSYYAAVPWNAVVAQWGCTVTSPATVSARLTGDGTPTVVVEEGHVCADKSIAAQAAGVVQPRSEVLATKGLRLAEPAAGAVSARRATCGGGTEVGLCLTQPASGQVGATDTFTGSGNAAAFIRLGRSSSLNSCDAGSLIATGGNGVWISGDTRSITASVNQNANWSNQWLRDVGNGAGFVSQGT